MKRLFAASLLVFVCICASAQSIVGSHSFEIGGGIILYGLIASHGGPERELGPGVFFEYRYAFAEHFDVGGQLNFKCGKGHPEYSGPGSPTFEFFDNQVALRP